MGRRGFFHPGDIVHVTTNQLDGNLRVYNATVVKLFQCTHSAASAAGLTAMFQADVEIIDGDHMGRVIRVATYDISKSASQRLIDDSEDRRADD